METTSNKFRLVDNLKTYLPVPSTSTCKFRMKQPSASEPYCKQLDAESEMGGRQAEKLTHSASDLNAGNLTHHSALVEEGLIGTSCVWDSGKLDKWYQAVCW